jgi:RNA recognition motif-containing protein
VTVRLFIGNLPYSTTEADLRNLFAAVGQPTQVLLPVDRETGRPRGFAFADFPDRETAEEVIRQFNGQPLQGRAIAVSEARAREDRPAGPRPPGGGPPPPRPFRSFDSPPPPLPRDPGAAPAPRRQRGPASGPAQKARTQQYEKGPRGPLKERTGSRLYDEEEEDIIEPVDFDDPATSRPASELEEPTPASEVEEPKDD